MGLVADDVTGLGVADNVLIPVAYGAAAAGFMYDNRELVMKRDREIAGIMRRVFKNNQEGITYALVATRDGYYTDVRKGKTY